MADRVWEGDAKPYLYTLIQESILSYWVWGGIFHLLRFLFGGNSGRTKNRKNEFDIVSIISLLVFVRDYRVHPRHSPRTFPLGLLAPRCLGLARFLALRHCGAGARAPAVWGKEGILPPASPLVSAGLDQPAQPTPFLVFISEYFSSLYTFSCLVRRRSSVSQDALAEMSEAQMQMRLTHPPVRAQARSQGRRGGANGISLKRIYFLFKFS